LNIPYPSLLIFASIGFTILLALPGFMRSAEEVEEKMYTYYLFPFTFYFSLRRVFGYIFFSSICYLLGALIDLFYFWIQEEGVGILSYFIILFSTSTALSTILFAGVGGVIKRMYERRKMLFRN